MEKVSVIIPVYNTEKYLERCLNSLSAQSYTNLEIILVDDGSTDRSPEICDKYCKKDIRFKYIHQKNRGAGAARNTGLDAMTGEYIVFVDSDDLIHPNMVSLLYHGVKKFHVSMGICGYQKFNEEVIYNEGQQNISEWLMSSKEAIKKLYTDERVGILIPCAKIYIRSMFDSLRFPEVYREDEHIIYKLLLKCNMIYCTDECLYYYYQREDSLMHTFHIKQETDYYNALLERNNYFRSIDFDQGIQEMDTAFCVKQLYNSFFLWDFMDANMRHYYTQNYVRMYDKCSHKRKELGKDYLRYFCARYMSKIFVSVWRIKKIVKKD